MFDFLKLKKTTENSALSQEEFILSAIKDFEASDIRANMIDGDNYYKNKNDVINKNIYRYENEVKVIDEFKSNNKISHGFLKLLVDEKIGYFLGIPPTFNSENNDLISKTNIILDDEFVDELNNTGVSASNKGIGWQYVYVDEEKKLRFVDIPSEQIIPFWCDINHSKLDAVIRYYYVDTFFGKEVKKVMKVEYWTQNTVDYYVMNDGVLIKDIDVLRNYDCDILGHLNIDGQEVGWGKVPFIPYKNNSLELSDLNYVKDIIDNYDKTTSNVADKIDEIQEVIYVLKNYGGTNLSEFMRDLNYYKSIKVDDDGGVDTIESNINMDSTEKHLDRLKKDFYIFGQGVDMNTDKFGASPSGVALEFLYSSLKLKVNNMERKFKKSFKDVFYFVCKYLEYTNQGAYNPNELNVTFTRSVITNDTEIIDGVNKSVTIISKETALEHHPWVDDVAKELERLENELDSLGEFDNSNNPMSDLGVGGNIG